MTPRFKSVLIFLLLSMASSVFATSGTIQGKAEPILTDAIATGPGGSRKPRGALRSFSCSGQTSAGAGTASVAIEGSNNNVIWVNIATVSLVLSTTTIADGFVSQAPWLYIRPNVTILTGTDATMACTLGVEG